MTETFQRLADWFELVFISQFSGWVALGFIAQALFTARMLVQWIASERARRSVVPMAFWLLSLFGSGLLLVYAIHREDPVFIAGQCFGFGIYLRNIWLIAGERSSALVETK